MLVSLGTRRNRIRSVSKSQMLWHESMRSIAVLQSRNVPAPAHGAAPRGKASGPPGVVPPCPPKPAPKPGSPTFRDHWSGFHRDGDRTVVDELDVHVSAEAAGGHVGAERGQGGREPLDQRLGLLRSGGGGPGRPPPPPGVAVEGELADDEDLATGLGDGHVHEP